MQVEGRTVGVVERKSLADLVSTITGGKLWFQMADVGTEQYSSSLYRLDPGAAGVA